MRNALFVLVFFVGALLGHYKGERDVLKIEKAVQEDLVKQYEEAAELRDKYKKQSKDYYDRYKEAINRPPTVVTDRVYVKASCPSDSSRGGVLDGGGDFTRAELHEETVRNLTRVSDQAERDVIACSLALDVLIKQIKGQQ